MENSNRLTTTRRQKCMMLILSLSIAVVAMSYSVTVSYFPQNAFSKGLTSGDVGIILGTFPVSTLFCGIFFNYALPIVGTRFIYLSSTFITAGSLIPFAFVMRANSGVQFYISCMMCRFMQGLGYVGVQISSIAIISGEFPDKISFFVGIFEMSLGVGLTIAPTIGGIVYDFAGFKAPIFLVSGVAFVLLIFGYVCVKPSYKYEKVEENSDSEQISYKLYRMPELLVPMISCVSILMDLTYLDVSLAPRVTEDLGESNSVAGALFAICCVLYAVLSPLVGMFLDKTKLYGITILVSCATNAVAFLFFGPVSFMPIKPSVGWTALSLALLGISGAEGYVPVLGFIISIFQRHGIPINKKVNQHVSGMIIFITNFGNLFGPLLGGYLLDYFGFEMVSLFISMKSVVVGTFVLLYLLCTRSLRQDHPSERQELLP